MKDKLELAILKEYELNNKELWIWGTGNTAQLYYEGLIRWQRYEQIKGYIDNNREKWGKDFLGKKIYAPQDIVNNENVIILICSNQSKFVNEIKEQLQNTNAEYYCLDEIVIYDLWEEVQKSYAVLDDDSKELYLYLLKCKIRAEYPRKEDGYISAQNEYFAFSEFCKLNDEEVFVDAGCYIADTIEEYIHIKGNHFKKIYAFEPDKVSYENAKEMIKTITKENQIDNKKIELYSYGLGKKIEVAMFERFEETNGSGSKFLPNKLDLAQETRVVSIDDFINEQIHFLKVDVESYEHQVIQGAKRSIKEWKPLVAISIYHNIFDFIQMPYVIKEIRPDYKMKILQHASSWSETILYAF